MSTNRSLDRLPSSNPALDRKTLIGVGGKRESRLASSPIHAKSSLEQRHTAHPASPVHHAKYFLESTALRSRAFRTIGWKLGSERDRPSTDRRRAWKLFSKSRGLCRRAGKPQSPELVEGRITNHASQDTRNGGGRNDTRINTRRPMTRHAFDPSENDRAELRSALDRWRAEEVFAIHE